jgi:hypothetical protein
MLMASEQLRNAASWIGKLELMWPDWEKESYPEVRDLALIPLFAIFFPTLRFFLDKFVFGVGDMLFSQPPLFVCLFVIFSFLFGLETHPSCRDNCLIFSSIDGPWFESLDHNQIQSTHVVLQN